MASDNLKKKSLKNEKSLNEFFFNSLLFWLTFHRVGLVGPISVAYSNFQNEVTKIKTLIHERFLVRAGNS